MKNKLFKLLGGAFLSVMLLTGCSQGNTKQIEELQAALNEQTTINTQLTEQVQKLQNEVDVLKAEKEALIEEVRQSDGAIIKLYTANVDTLAREEIGKLTVEVDENGNIKEIEAVLKTMAKELSKQVFEGLPIEIKEIKIVDGKQIAVINLKEDNNLSTGWASNFLQGSTGAAITELTLKETFLQKEFEKEWIEGIQILYEGDSPEFDHMVGLGEIIYR